MQSRNHVDTQPVKRFKCLTLQGLFVMSQVRKNEISLRSWSGGTAHLRSCAPEREHCSSCSFSSWKNVTFLRTRFESLARCM